MSESDDDFLEFNADAAVALQEQHELHDNLFGFHDDSLVFNDSNESDEEMGDDDMVWEMQLEEEDSEEAVREVENLAGIEGSGVIDLDEGDEEDHEDGKPTQDKWGPRGKYGPWKWSEKTPVERERLCAHMRYMKLKRSFAGQTKTNFAEAVKFCREGNRCSYLIETLAETLKH